STTARKATGSYYTPREIVDYMVTESLKEYFKTHLPNIKNIDKKLEALFSTGRDENPFSKSESKKLVELIESVRIIDPAVGSGAFPMGALNRMVFILNKIDPGNEFWKQAQLKAAEVIPDPQVRRNTMRQIEEFFKDKNADYSRKLYLIQKCIYGVDIQQIAVEIAKLRFFISLLVDEKIDEKKENWGIEPLPNLDFKIMQGNSLISEFLGINFDNGQTKQEQVGMLFAEKEDGLIKEFEQKKINFQNESDKDKKAKLKNEVEDLMIKIFEVKVKKQKADYFRQIEEIERKYSALPNKKTQEEMIVKEKQKLSQKTGFDLENIEKQLREFNSKNKTKPFFAWKLYFAEVFEKGGFDIVIANPPYLDYRKIDRKSKQLLKKYQCEEKSIKPNLYVFFIERSLSLLKAEGVLIFINPNYFLSADYAYGIRKILLSNTIIKFLLDVSRASVFTAGTYTFVWGVKKSEPPGSYKIRLGRIDKLLDVIVFKDSGSLELSEITKHKKLIFPLTESIELITKIETCSKELREIVLYFFWGTSQAGYGKKKISSQQFSRLPENKRNQYCKIIQTADIKRYRIDWTGEYIPKKLYSTTMLEKFDAEKIVIARVTKRIQAAIDKDGYCVGKASIIINPKISIKVVLALLNTALVNFWFREKFHTLHMAGDYLRFDIPYLWQIPISEKIINNKDEQKPFIDLVDKILAITEDDDYLQDSAKQVKVREYEKQIDRLVYKLYGLTKEEIKIVEGEPE
ncbi:MAG: TaqI-like C-terminal specificity domain-containing protein, partial [Candidatus Moranbacteria bacterium]|nr:TaqI-like C-terminal specificity domain-containing protein [Candidatus Moranbacteria bacterium]